jgi:hypothetical protein
MNSSNTNQKKKKVVFEFDKQSEETEEQWRANCAKNNWKVVEVKTTTGVVLIPQLHS